MNCKYVQELLPLYVGRDLEAKRAQTIAAHMQSCAECAVSFAEYRETRQLLQEFAPPSFDEAVFDGIRQRVLREIEREAHESHKSIAPGFSRLLENAFRPRLRWAMVTALLLAVCLSVLYFMGNRPGNPTNQQMVKSSITVDVPQPDEQRRSPDASTSPSSPGKASNRQSTGADRTLAGTPRTFGSKQRKGPGLVVDSIRTVALNTSDPRSLNTQTLPLGNNGAAKPEPGLLLDPAAQEKTMRVEIQTQDPNIRIIWFAHQPTKQDSPVRSSKGI